MKMLSSCSKCGRFIMFLTRSCQQDIDSEDVKLVDLKQDLVTLFRKEVYEIVPPDRKVHHQQFDVGDNTSHLRLLERSTVEPITTKKYVTNLVKKKKLRPG